LSREIAILGEPEEGQPFAEKGDSGACVMVETANHYAAARMLVGRTRKMTA